VALRRAGADTAGASIYITLEPCCHTGKTGPCTQVIIDSGIKRVICATRDPDPRVNGRGVACLRRAGILVKTGLLRKAATRLNEVHFGYWRNKRPFVTLKLAQTLDGRIATVTADSRWISGKESRRYVHVLRSEVDAVVVGMGTVKADNPTLAVQLVNGSNPYRIVLSRSLAFPRGCRLLADNADQKTVIASTAEAIERFSGGRKGRSLTYWAVRPGREGLLSVEDFMKKAAAFGLRSLLVEGGAGLATSFIRAGMIDKYVFVMAPKVMGEGLNGVGDLRVRSLAGVLQFDDCSFEPCGSDIIFTGYPRRRRK
jgi:diaminohydroxyphosphoribosylaminopyrimidine deaminase/5-amino-6-(5-phosphoribosylamino)uracil reductase